MIIEPYRHNIAVGVESTFNWYWLRDGCKKADIPFYLGHALYMKTIHFPLAYPYPEEMRATRDLLRRRHRFVALRAEGYTHIQNTFSQQAINDITSFELPSFMRYTQLNDFHLLRSSHLTDVWLNVKEHQMVSQLVMAIIR